MKLNVKLIKYQKKKEKLILALIITIGVVIDLFLGIYYNWEKVLLFVVIISILLITIIHTNRPRRCIICGVKMKRIVSKNDFIIFKCEICNNSINTGVGLNGNPS